MGQNVRRVETKRTVFIIKIVRFLVVFLLTKHSLCYII